MCWAFRLSPYFGCSEKNFYEHSSSNIYVDIHFHFSWTLSSSGNNSKWLTTLSPSFPLHWVQTLASQPPDPGCCWEMGSLLPMLSVSRGCCGDLGRQRTGGFFVTWHRYMHRCCRVLVICKWRTRSADYPCPPPCSAPPPISDGRAGPGWVSGSLLTAHPFAPSPFPTEIQLYLLSQQPSAWNGALLLSTRRQGQGDREQDVTPDWSKPIAVILLPLSVTGWNMDTRHKSDQWT